jgi:uncharacterized membrane-anchored protein
MLMDAVILRKVLEPKMNIKSYCWLTALALLCGSSFAENVAPTSMAPSGGQFVRWTDGPTAIEIAGVATLQLSEGYRFADSKSARIILQTQKTDDNLIGIVVSQADKKMILLTYVPIGYIKTAATDKINADAVMADIQERIPAQSRNYVKWEIPPELNFDDHTLEYAFRIQSPASTSVKQFVRKFGREGVVVARTESASASTAVKDVVSSISFKEGYRYADYESGDKLASLDVTQLITGFDYPTVVPHGLAKLSRATLIWTICGIGACVLALVGFLVTKEIRSLKPQRTYHTRPAWNQVNGNAKGRHGLRRKRAFDYQRFYTDMMLQVSGRATLPAVAEAETAVNGAETHPVADAHAAQTVTTELIEQQKEFIEEQRRLMAQQARMIEERSRLIEEKNRIIAKQSEMIESHLL